MDQKITIEIRKQFEMNDINMTYQNLGNVTKAGLRGNTVFCIQMHSMKKETLKV